MPEITVSKDKSDKGQYGETRYTILHIGIFSKCENANVTIFPNMLLRRPNVKLLTKIPKVFEAMIIGILAHELRAHISITERNPFVHVCFRLKLSRNRCRQICIGIFEED